MSTASSKRVILRLRVHDFDSESHSWNDHIDAIQCYFQWAKLSSPSENDHSPKRYFAHVEPFQALELQQRTFHVILDIQPLQPVKNEDVDLDIIPHEIYQIRRKPGGDL